MANVLGSLVVRLGLDAAEFTAGLTKAQYQSQKFARDIGESFRGIGIGIAAAAAGATAFVAVINKAADSVTVYKGLADQMGATAEAISGLQQAADLSGVSLDSVASASVRLTSNLAKGVDGARGTAAALAALNIRFDDFRKLDPVSQMEQVAFQLGKFEDGANKTAVAVELFGRSGAQMLSFFGDLNTLGGKNVRLTQEQIDEADRFQKSLARLKNEISELGRAVLVNLVPPLNSLLDRFNTIRRESVGLVDSLVGALAPGLAAKNLQQGIDFWNKEIARLEKMLSEPPRMMQGDTPLAQRLTAQYTKELEDARKALRELERQRNVLAGATATRLPDMDDPLAAPAGQINFSPPDTEQKARTSEAQRYLQSLEKQLESTKNLTVHEQLLLDIQKGRIEGITPGLQAQLEAMAKQIDATRTLAIEKEKEQALQDLIATATQRNVDLQERENKALQDKASGYLDLADPMREFIRKLEEIDSLVAKGFLSADMAAPIKAALVEAEKPVDEFLEYSKNAAQGVQSAFAEFLFDPFKDGLDGLARNFAKVVQRMVAEATAAQVMKALFGDWASSGTMGGIIGEAFGGARASGGPVSPGATYLVGERGPELFRPNAAGSIVPNHALGGVSISQTFNVGGGASKADMIRAAEMGRMQAVAEIEQIQARR